MKSTIVFTGGHHNSSLVIAKMLKKQGYKIAWIGHKYASSKDKSLSAEYQEVTACDIPFYPLKTGKFYRHVNPFEYLKIILGFFQSFSYLIKIRPSLVVSFGGYLAVPVVIVSWLLGIPSVTHEQTVTVGWANKAISPFVRKILLTHPSSLNQFPKNKAEVVGLPLEEEILNENCQKEFTPPLIFITCGKQGSHTINQAVFPIIPELVKDFTVIHQTGANTRFKDVEKARRLRDSLGEYKSRYFTAPYFFGKEFATYITSAHVVVSRSGAHTAYKIAYLGKRSVLIPIPWVSHNEQMKNAKLVQESTPTIILEEKDLSSQSLLEAINQAAKLKNKPAVTTLPTNATQKIHDIIHQYV